MKTIHKKECSKCNGKGTIGSGRPMIDSHICFECNGTGEKLSQKEPEEAWEKAFSKKFTDNVLKDGYGNDLITEQALDIMEFIKRLLSQQRTQTIEEINMGLRHLSGQWEGKTMEWVEGNKQAFRDIIKYFDSLK